jgi:DNA-binding MarR family transcriptional regulator
MADGPATKAKASDAVLRRFSGYVMKRAFATIQSDVNRSLEPLGLRMLSFSALAVIADNPGLRQSQLADALAIERPNLVVLVDELEKAGLITRNPAPDDRRALALEPTPAGVALCARAMEAVAAHEARMTKDISKAEREALIDALTRIERAGD